MRNSPWLHRGGPAVVAGLATVAVAACGAAGHPGGTASPRPAGGCTAATAVASATVLATSKLRFVPATVCLQRGGTVTWKNVATALDHTSTDEPSLAVNPPDAEIPPGGRGWNHLLRPGESASVTFTTVGTYRYFCIPHETFGMLGKVIVVG